MSRADHPAGTAPFKVGDEYRRLSDGRTFRVDFLNLRAGVFSATPTDGKWSHDGGPVWAHAVEMISPASSDSRSS